MSLPYTKDPQAFAFDDYTTAVANLAGKTAEGGSGIPTPRGTWVAMNLTEQGAVATNLAKTTGGYVIGATGTGRSMLYYLSKAPPSADYAVSSPVQTLVHQTSYITLAARCGGNSVATGTFILGCYIGSGVAGTPGFFRVYVKAPGSAAVQLAGMTAPLINNGEAHNFELAVIGDRIIWSMDGVAYIDLHDSTVQAAGFPGVNGPGATTHTPLSVSANVATITPLGTKPSEVGGGTIGTVGGGTTATALAGARNGAGSAVQGAFTPTSLTVKAPLSVAGAVGRLVVSTSPGLLGSHKVSDPVTADTGNNLIAALTVSGLLPNTKYYWGVQVDGVLTPIRGSGKTFPAGAANLKLALMSCSVSGSNQPVFDKILAKTPDLLMHQGDMHYDNVSTADVPAHLAAFAAVMALSKQAALYRSAPLLYVPDDHDTAGDNCYSGSPGMPSAVTAWDRVFPHYTLTTAQMHQVATYGRVRIIQIDARSGRDIASKTDDTNKTMLGAGGRQWLKDQLLAAHHDPSIRLIILGTQLRWHAYPTPAPGADGWNGYTAERQDIASWILAQPGLAAKILQVNGDSHKQAIDSGASNTFGGFPAFDCGSLQHSTAAAIGTYDIGQVPNPDSTTGQYGIISVTDPGGASALTVTLTGYQVTSGGVETVNMTHTFTVA